MTSTELEAILADYTLSFDEATDEVAGHEAGRCEREDVVSEAAGQILERGESDAADASGIRNAKVRPKNSTP